MTIAPAEQTIFRLLRRVEPLTMIVALAAIVWCAPSARLVKACWSDDQANFRAQLSRATRWELVHVIEKTYTGLSRRPGEDMLTHVRAETVDIYGNAEAEISFAFEGADVPGGATSSTTAKMNDGGFYIVMLIANPRSGELRLLEGAISVFEVSTEHPGEITPWDSVHFHRGHAFVPRGATRQVSDAQLFDVLDILTELKPKAGNAKATP